MDETTFTFPTDDGESIFVYRWTGEGEPKAIVQIAHGMGEHAARYRRLGGELVEPRLRRLRERPPRPRAHGRQRRAPRPARPQRLERSGRRRRHARRAGPKGASGPAAPGDRAQHGLVRAPAAHPRAQRCHGRRGALRHHRRRCRRRRDRPNATGRPHLLQRAVRAGPHRVRLAEPRPGRGRPVRGRPDVRVRRGRRGHGRHARAAPATWATPIA